jgi:replication factor C large subunit
MNENIPLTEKYRAKDFSEIVGQKETIEQVKDFLLRFPKQKAIALSGPVGTGKTSIAIACAKEYDFELFELNASDIRNRARLDEVLKPAIEQQSLFKKGKIIFMDEADGITGSEHGGVTELIYLIDKTEFPIIITANDIWSKKLAPLRKKCKVVSLKELDKYAIAEIISRILKKENKKITQETMELIVEKSKGDARAAINDLQSIFSSSEDDFITDMETKIKAENNSNLEKETVEEDKSERDKQDTIFNAIKKVFQNKPNEKTIAIYDNIDMGLDEITLWIDENMPFEYDSQDLAKAYESLSNADLFKSRIYRQQYWRFLVYQNFFLSAGVSCASKKKKIHFTKYNRPSRVLKIWLANQKYARRKSIAIKYAKLTHSSKKRALRESFLMPFIIDKDSKERLKLDEKEIEYLNDKKASEIIFHNLNRFKE